MTDTNLSHLGNSTDRTASDFGVFDNDVTAAIDAQRVIAPQYGIPAPQDSFPGKAMWATRRAA